MSELESVLRQAARRGKGGLLRAADARELLAPIAMKAEVQIPLGTSLAVAEQLLLRATRAVLSGNKNRTAEALGSTRRTLYLKIGRS